MINEAYILSITSNIKKVVFFVLVLWLQISFSQYKIINEGWQFSEDQNSWQTVNIPHTWNVDDAFDDKPGYRRGLGYYKKQVFISSNEKNKIQYLKFNAVNQEASVYVNGKLVGDHKGGYTAFNFDITSFINYDKYNLIEIIVDNSHNENIPPLDADFTFYGGVYRDVEFISLPKQHFSVSDFASDGYYVNYNDVSEKSAEINVQVIVANKAANMQKSSLKITLFDDEGNQIRTHSETLNLKSNISKEFFIKFHKIKNPNLWSPESPYLYQLKLTLSDEKGTVLDSKSSNIGFRWASIDPKRGFFLNGKPIKLVGVNRHQDYKGYGNAVPIELQKKDIYSIKKMGANFIRFAHYPHARELYAVCDKLGILVWTEIPVVNKVTDTKAFFETSINMQKEHIKQYYNYPSVVMFGYMNEIFLRLAFDNKSSDSEKENGKTSSVKLAQQLETVTRQLAPNHLTVMALHFNELYNETGIADIPMLIGWNLYFGWYHDKIPDLGVFLDEQHKRYPNRSLLLSEYGPGADARIFTATPKKYDYSLDYQFLLHNGYYNQVVERDYMVGMSAWNYADFGSEFRGDAIPHVNQKGLLQYDRTPKDVYYWYKSVLDKANPFIHIAANYLSGLTLFGNETYPVQIYGNEDTVAVYLNDKKLEEVALQNGYALVQIPFVDGGNVIKVISDSAKDEQHVEVSRIDALDFKKFSRFAINIGSHFFFKDKINDITFVPDQKYTKGLYGNVDGKVFNLSEEKHQGIPYNIRNTTSEPLYQTMLEGCTAYKVDVPNGTYKVQLFFVEPQIKPTADLYSLNAVEQKGQIENQRIFDIYLNNELLQANFNMATEYPEKYGVTKKGVITIEDENGLSIFLKSKEGKSVISGILVEKI